MHWDEKMLANYLVHIYECDQICMRESVAVEAMVMTEGELSDAILAAHTEEN